MTGPHRQHPTWPCRRTRTRFGRLAPRSRPVAGGAALLAFATILFLAPQGPLAAEVLDRILATIDGGPITLYDLDRYKRQVGATGGVLPDEKALLEGLITERIIAAEVKAKGIAIRETDIDRYVEDVKSRNRINEKQLRAALEQQGVKWETYRTHIRRELEKARLINRDIRGKVNVTPEEIQRYYDAHKADYAIPEQFSISHIVLRVAEDAPAAEVTAVEKHAMDLYRKLRDGADFAELARANSQDAAAKGGGYLGTFKKGEMLDAMEKQVRHMKEAEFSKPFRTPVGIHIVRLDRHTPPSFEPLKIHAVEIKEKLYKAALDARYERWLREDLRKRHHVEILP